MDYYQHPLIDLDVHWTCVDLSEPIQRNKESLHRSNTQRLQRKISIRDAAARVRLGR